MKIIPTLILASVICSTSYADSLIEANIPKNLTTILSDFRFKSGDPSWKTIQDTRLSNKSVFVGSAYCVFAEPSPAPTDYQEVAVKIRDEFRRIYGLKSTSAGASGTMLGGSGEAYFSWHERHGDPGGSNATISITVRVTPLRDGEIGISLNVVDVK